MNKDPGTVVPTDEEVQQLHRTGFLVLRRFLQAAMLDTLEALADQSAAYHNSFPDHLEDVYKDISRKDDLTIANQATDDSPAAERLARLAVSESIAAVARAVGGPRVGHRFFQIVYKYPHTGSPIPWHQDHSHMPTDRLFYTLWIALSEATEANGCLWVLPEIGLDQEFQYHSTEWGLSCWPLDHPNQGRPIEVERGDAVILTSRALHKSGPNRTDGFRKAFLVTFVDERARIQGMKVNLRPYA